MSSIRPVRLFFWLVIALVLFAVMLVFVGFFERIPMEHTSFAIDWRAFHAAVSGGNLVYAPTDGLRVPPWSAIFIMPLGFFSLGASWGLLALISFTILVFSVPRVFPRWKHWLSVMLLAASFLALRLAADGNFEGFIIAGAALMVYAYRKQHAGWMALGLLLATFKPQAVVLLLVAMGLDMIVQPSRRTFAFKTGILVLAVVIPTMLWRGSGWLAAFLGENYQFYTGNYLDVSLGAAIARIGLPSIIGLVGRLLVGGISLYIALRHLWQKTDAPSRFTREKAGLLMAASLLISPYAAGNTILTVLAIGVIPLFQKRLWLGGILIALSDAALLLHRPEYISLSAYYWTAYLLLTWVVLAVVTWQEDVKSREIFDNAAKV